MKNSKFTYEAMRITFIKNTFLFLVLFALSCGNNKKESPSETDTSFNTPLETAERVKTEPIVIGATRFSDYKSLLQNKKVAVVANQTSMIEYYAPDSIQNKHTKPQIYIEEHLVDFLLDNKINVQKVFAPEHGFRGRADAGESVKDQVDTKTGLPILSLHGKHKKPTEEQLQDVDVVVFDIQDVGVRFYTYISTMHLVMEACAEAGIPFIVLDRPNPNGHFVDGPMMEKEHTGFLGMHEVPLVHGMTIGEYAQMINGEGWLEDGMQCDLTVITMENYTHDRFYSVPVRPSPNLPNDVAINLYPSLGLLEGTNLNAGRGTEMQFQIFGSPHLPIEHYPYQYTPEPNFGSKYPKHQGVVCNGLDLRETKRLDRIDLIWILDAYKSHTDKENFFNTKNFTAHAGTEVLQQQIMQGLTDKEIRKTWMRPLEAYKKMREKYLLYE